MTDETKHSPEPWRIVDGEELGTFDVAADLGGSGAACAYITAQMADEEDARRIVACVNACAGIPTAALEAGALGGALGAAAWFAERPASGTAADDAEALSDLRENLRVLGWSRGPGVSGKDGGAK